MTEASTATLPSVAAVEQHIADQWQNAVGAASRTAVCEYHYRHAVAGTNNHTIVWSKSGNSTAPVWVGLVDWNIPPAAHSEPLPDNDQDYTEPPLKLKDEPIPRFLFPTPVVVALQEGDAERPIHTKPVRLYNSSEWWAFRAGAYDGEFDIEDEPPAPLPLPHTLHLKAAQIALTAYLAGLTAVHEHQLRAQPFTTAQRVSRALMLRSGILLNQMPTATSNHHLEYALAVIRNGLDSWRGLAMLAMD